MKLDLDALEHELRLTRKLRVAPRIGGDELAALVQIARAAVAWRDNSPQSGTLAALLDSLREAGL